MAETGIEPGTPRTRGENHTTRPTSRCDQNFMKVTPRQYRAVDNTGFHGIEASYKSVGENHF